jgi:hypothetical protein
MMMNRVRMENRWIGVSVWKITRSEGMKDCTDSQWALPSAKVIDFEPNSKFKDF